MKTGLNRLITSAANWRRCLVIGMLVLIGYNNSLAQEVLSPGPYKAPMKYAVQLPEYCWGRYFGRKEPQYNIRDCGPGMNHFCVGLMKLMQARESFDKRKKVQYLKAAKGELLYTKKAVEPYPRCPLRRDVANALAEVQAGLMVFGR